MNARIAPARAARPAPWSVDRWGRLLAGLATLACVMLALLVDPWWLLGVAAVAANLLVTSITDRCPVRAVLLQLGAREREDLFYPGGKLRHDTTETGDACA